MDGSWEQAFLEREWFIIFTETYQPIKNSSRLQRQKRETASIHEITRKELYESHSFWNESAHSSFSWDCRYDNLEDSLVRVRLCSSC